MRIESYLNTTKEEVESKKHNIWIGVSLGNKYFSKENIKQYIEWALEHTKDSVLVVICDAIQAFNIEVLDGNNYEAAYRRAIRIGDTKFAEVNKIVESLSQESRDKIRVARWSDVTNTGYYRNQLKIVKEFFKQDKKFYDLIIEIVRSGRKDRESRISTLSKKELERIAEYILNELPHFVNGVQGYDDKIYTLIPYPGLSKLDELFVGLNNKTIFPELAEKLNIQNKVATIEAFAD